MVKIDPCSLLDPAIISQNHLSAGARFPVPAARLCQWDSPVTEFPGYVIAIGIYDSYGFGDLNHHGFDISDYPVGRHRGHLVTEHGDDTCGIDIEVTSKSLVDVGATATNNDVTLACQIAEATAKTVEPKLPLGNG